MFAKPLFHSARAVAGALLGIMVAASAARAQSQNAIITGKVVGDAGQPIEFANVYISELTLSVPTNAQGSYSISIPAARALGQADRKSTRLNSSHRSLSRMPFSA